MGRKCIASCKDSKALNENRMKRRLALLLLTLWLMPHMACAATGDWQRDSDVGVRLIAGVDGVGTDQTVPLGLEVQLSPGWHSYWRSPGPAGLPPALDWHNGDDGNLKSAALLYPAPTRTTAYGLETIGYEDHVVFPIEATLRKPGQPLSIEATLDLLVCSAICVPKNFTLKLTIPAGPAKESTEAPLIKAAHEHVPGSAAQSGLVIKSIINDGASLAIEIESREALRAPDVFAESSRISFGAPEVTAASDNHSAVLKIAPLDTLPDGVTLAGMPLTLTIVNGDRALEQRIKAPGINATPKPIAPKPLALGLVLLFALAGGFILNLMPCVLPVLSLKVLSAVGHGGGETRLVRQSFLMTAAGILFSFLALAGMTIALKELGLTLGWGVQFQQPAFLMALVILLTLFAANLWGFFEIHLPRWLADSAGAVAVASTQAGAEQSRHTMSYHPKLAGDFATGALATMLATPCSAPFLGTAVGFALAAGAREILMVFATLGLGMVMPYLAIALFPRLATTLPKPGSWMIDLRRTLGLALALTATWLVWVLAAQITVPFAVLAGLCMTGIVLLLALGPNKVSKKLIRLGLIELSVIALGLTAAGSVIPKPLAEVDRQWLPFDQNELAADVAEGKTVFVDITADWCLTCQANKKFVLSDGALGERLFHDGVIAMQADWTNPDPVIAEFLHKYGRYGIPFNAAFGPGAPDGLILPELLTKEKVMKALDRAAQK